jgi:hypothetical protein
MEVYSLIEDTGNAGCYGIFTTAEKATEAALKFINDWGYGDVKETVWDGYQKHIYYDEGRFTIERQILDAC